MDHTFIARITGRIETFLGEFAGPMGIFPVEILVRGQRNNLVVEVYLDGDRGIDTAGCAGINRALAKDLDAGILSGESYTLTVSSPGLDRPLKFPRQYPKHVGRAISVKLRQGGEPRVLKGVLVSAGERSISVRTGKTGAPMDIGFESILEAKIETPW